MATRTPVISWWQEKGVIHIHVPRAFKDGTPIAAPSLTKEGITFENRPLIPWFEPVRAFILDPDSPQSYWNIELAIDTPQHWPRLYADKAVSKTHAPLDWSRWQMDEADEFLCLTDGELEAMVKRMAVAYGDAEDLDMDEDYIPNGHPAFLGRAKAEGRWPPQNMEPEDKEEEAANDALMERLDVNFMPDGSLHVAEKKVD